MLCYNFFYYLCNIVTETSYMINDSNPNNERTIRTIRPQEMKLEMDRPLEQPAQQMQYQQQKQSAAGKLCPYCGAINEPEAMFCAQCGQPISKTLCPHCGAEVDPDADYCESCRHYIKQDICSFCGAHLSGNEAYCPECGSPKGGLVCPTCHTLNEFAFCKKCGTALTEEARHLVKELQLNPDYHELMEVVQEYTKLENALPYNSERDITREQVNIKLRERLLTLLAQDEGVKNPVIPKVASKRMTREELEEQKKQQIKALSAILDKLAVPPSQSPAVARNYAMASKPIGVRLAWVCNYKHAMHSSPCGCAKPQLGGKWVVLGKNTSAEIKDDK